MASHSTLLASAFGKKKAFVSYITFGDPDIHTSLRIMRAAVDAGSDVLEVGIPFSDPIADGPVIQASHQRALSQSDKPSLARWFSVLSHEVFSVPIVMMLSANLVLRYGISSFFSEAQRTGVAGVVIPDLSIEDAEEYLRMSRRYAVPIVFLVSILCTQDRIQKIVKQAQGFVYLISSTGLTGARDVLPMADISSVVASIKEVKDIPVAVGFGIKTASQVSDIWGIADGVIVGSALVSSVASSQDPVSAIAKTIKSLKPPIGYF